VVLDICDCSVYVPNAFTPNNDGKNDIFRPITDCPDAKFLFRIFDRWGQLVYEEINSSLSGWDGFFKGTPAPGGVYTWSVKLLTAGNVNDKVYSGNVLLIR